MTTLFIGYFVAFSGIVSVGCACPPEEYRTYPPTTWIEDTTELPSDATFVTTMDTGIRIYSYHNELTDKTEYIYVRSQ